MKQVKCALTIAGTDPSGGAGIHADLKTFQELKTYGMSVITSVVAQNTTGVQAVHHIPIDMIEKQLDSVINDMPIHAFKTGMIAHIDMMQVIKKKIESLNVPYVMDPVMVAASGDPLIAKESQQYLRDELLPLTYVVTPNIPEAEVITGISIQTEDDMKQAAKLIVNIYGAHAALVKGGHYSGDATDFLYDGEQIHRLTTKRIDTKNSHGTGCTLSAAITAYLAQGENLVNAVIKAKDYITQAIRYSFDLGSGSGPTNHWAPRMNEVTQIESKND